MKWKARFEKLAGIQWGHNCGMYDFCPQQELETGCPDCILPGDKETSEKCREHVIAWADKPTESPPSPEDAALLDVIFGKPGEIL